MTLLEAAQWYARMGWEVLPTEPGRKTPVGWLAPDGVYSATRDPEQIADLWRRKPDAGIAIANGGTGPDVIDIDDRNAIPATLAAALLSYTGPTAASARGLHLYGRAQLGDDDDGRTRILPFGELRRLGGYTIAPPTLHASGKTYTWLVEPAGELPALPSVEALAAPAAGSGSLHGHEGLLPIGQRHAALTDLAVRLVRAGIVDERDLAAVLTAYAKQRCAPPAMPVAEIDGIAKWAATTRIAERERADASGLMAMPGAPRSLALVLGALQRIGQPYSVAVSLGACPACGAPLPWLTGSSGDGLRASCERGCTLAAIGDALHAEINPEVRR